jgi:pimeloyl-ACP methyl ester carboxylesterase
LGPLHKSVAARGGSLLLALLVVLGIWAAAAGILVAPGVAAAKVPAPKFNWGSCESEGARDFQCDHVRVPRDYDNPRGAKVRLALIRHRSTEPARRIGTLFYNPGGPGGAGVDVLPQILDFFPAALRARFDIVSWDPRGVGESSAVQCFSDLEVELRFLDGATVGQQFPVGKAEQRDWIRRYRAYGQRCGRRNGDLLRHVGTADTARDLNLLRRAVGDPKLNYLGVSYGTFLGATYANLFPRRVRAMTLDGNIDPRSWIHRRLRANGGTFLPTFLRQRSDEGLAKTMSAFLERCGRTGAAACAFSAGTAEATEEKWAQLLSRLPADSASAETSYPELFSQTVTGLYVSTQWPDTAKRIQDVETGAASRPAAAAPLPGVPFERGAGERNAARYAGPEQAFSVYCAESPNPGAAAFPSLARLAYERSGLAGPYWTWFGEVCADWPARAADRYDGPWDRRTARPVLVIGNTHDPATPYSGSQAMAQQLARGRLLKVRGYGHTTLFNPSTCASEYERRYFVGGRLPPKGTVCSQDPKPFSGP